MKLDLLRARFEQLCREVPSPLQLREALSLLKAEGAWLTAVGELFCEAQPGDFVAVANGDVLYLGLRKTFGYQGQLHDPAFTNRERSPLA